MEEDGGGGLDLRFRETAEGDVFDDGDAGEAVLFEAGVFDAVESYNQREWWRCGGAVAGHGGRRSGSGGCCGGGVD